MSHSEKKSPLAISIPALLFSLVAVAAFCTWAFGGGVFKSETALYTACAVVFLGLGGFAIHPYSGINSRGKMAITFAIGFAVYSVIWTAAWFTFRNTFGEVIGSFAGLTGLMLVFKKMLKLSAPLIVLISVAFLWHTVGYYAGGFFHQSILGKGVLDLSGLFDSGKEISKLAWGAFYGLGMGLGLSQAIQLSRKV